MPWALDLVHRWSQGGSVTTFTAANMSDDKTITTLQLTTARVRPCVITCWLVLPPAGSIARSHGFGCCMAG